MTASASPVRRAMKPLFVKRLPPHVQVVSGQSLVTTCQMRTSGCRPCFIKRLPSNMEVCRGNHVEVRCQDRVATEKNIGRMQQSLEMETDIRGSVWKGKRRGGPHGRPVLTAAVVKPIPLIPGASCRNNAGCLHWLSSRLKTTYTQCFTLDTVWVVCYPGYAKHLLCYP